MSTDATRCYRCGGEFSDKRTHIDGKYMHPSCAFMSGPPHTQADMAAVSERAYQEGKAYGMELADAVNRLAALSDETVDRVAAAITATMFIPEELPTDDYVTGKIRGTAIAAIKAMWRVKDETENPLQFVGAGLPWDGGPPGMEGPK